MNTKDDNKDTMILKNKLWTKRVSTEAKVAIFRKNQVVEKTTWLDEIRRNQTRKQKVQKKLEKDDGQAWENDSIIYIEERIYVSNNQKI